MTENIVREEITGVMVQYFKACKRELWFFSHNINLNKFDENIKLGKQIHEESYSRKKKEISLGSLSFDLIERSDELKVIEVKKSSKLKEPAKYQLYYYLWALNKIGLEAKGEIAIPRENKRKKIELTQEKAKEIKNILERIQEIINKDKPPEKEKKPYCSECSYFDFCWV